jgi:hypothetical protein
MKHLSLPLKTFGSTTSPAFKLQLGDLVSDYLENRVADKVWADSNYEDILGVLEMNELEDWSSN